MGTTILIIAVVFLFALGLLGVVLPAIPGLPILWLGVLVYGWATGFQEVTVGVVVLTGIIALIGMTLDFLAGVLGAKTFGASWYGVLGALLGGIFGFIAVSVFGLFIGSFVGAWLGEYLKYERTSSATKAGFGTIMGIVFGMVLKIIFALVIIGIFVWKIV